MAEAAVSSVLNRLAPLIEKKVRQEVNLHLNADNNVQTLVKYLKEIQKVLADAERRLLKNDVKVESWLQKLHDIAYEIEDALDEWEVENVKQQLEESQDASESDSWVEKVCSLLGSICLCFKQTVHRRSIALDIEQLIARLDSLAQENENELNFIPKLDTDSQPVEYHVDRNTTSFVDLSEIHGRDLDKEILLTKLLSDGSGEGGDGVKIISIVGVGGMGKTTLAQLLLKDNRIKDQFQEKLWVCVSDPFDAIKIVKTILEGLGRDSSSSSQFDALLKSIEMSISGRRFLLVLDDVWTENDVKWKPLKVCLKSGAAGSRILVTTRKIHVAQIMGSTDHDVHELNPLGLSHCWSILSQIAFQCKTEFERKMLEKTGREIAKKCKGSPLVAKTIGSLLRFNEDWENVLQSDMWKLEEVRNDIFPLLKLSYDELQPEIRRCFSYCAIFPKDKILKVDELVRMWMAQGFVLPSSLVKTRRELEDIGRQYFKNLALRSFFQDFTKDEYGHITLCKMHDIVHDFAQFLMNNECLIVEQVDKEEETLLNEKVVRHLTIISPDGSNVVNESLNLEDLRSFSSENLTNPSLSSLFTHLKRVRLLKISSSNLRDIPREIGKLIHLSYLILRHNPMKKLHETICDLYNLQTLDIEGCDECELPQGIHKLKKLRHLINNLTFENFKFFQGFEKLINLKHLDGKISFLTSST